MGCSASSMNYALGNSFMVKMINLLTQMEVLKIEK